MNQTTPTIVLTGGGSGGHIIPLLSLAQELKAKSPDCQIIYIGYKGDNFDNLKLSRHDFDFTIFINAGKFRRYHGGKVWLQIIDVRTWFFNIRDFFRVLKSVGTCLKILKKFQPDVVFSKGGFVAVPVGIAAHLRHVAIITHDSDTVPGLANRIVGRWAKVHATGMPASYYKYPKQSIEYVGIPLDERIKKVSPKLQAESKKQLKLPPDAQVLLLTGGGNGSQDLNDLLLAVAPNLLESNLSLHILHVTGRQHEAVVKQAYHQTLPKNQQERVRVVGFTPDLYVYSAAADLVIARAGATTLAQLAVQGKACIIIPANFLTGGHQLKNAQHLDKLDAALVINDEITPDELLVTVTELLNNDHRRWELAKNLYGTAQPYATDKLAQIILNNAKKRS